MRRLPLFLAFLLATGVRADDSVTDAFPLRNHNPFVQVFGLPPFATTRLVAPGTWSLEASCDIANDSDDRQTREEGILIDGETRIVALSLRRRVARRVELGLYLPLVSHSGGFLDATIESWHSLLGLSNATRDKAQNQLHYRYERAGLALFDMTSAASGIGDVQVAAAVPLGNLVLRGAVKLPTGDPDRLLGSGAADVSLGAYMSHTTRLFDRELQVSGFGGALALGNGDVLPGLQRSVVPYGGLALRWRMSERLAVTTQWYLQGAWFDSVLDEIGGETVQLGVGLDYRPARGGFALRAAVVEDIAARAAPDFALHLSLRRDTR